MQMKQKRLDCEETRATEEHEMDFTPELIKLVAWNAGWNDAIERQNKRRTE